MGMFLNSHAPHDTYKEILSDPYFVDKSSLIGELIPMLGRQNRYICITRPRRFGKTVMAAMIAAFFGKTDAQDSLFDNLIIAWKLLFLYRLYYTDCQRIKRRFAE